MTSSYFSPFFFLFFLLSWVVIPVVNRFIIDIILSKKNSASVSYRLKSSSTEISVETLALRAGR
jgi:hypothetical protein